MEDLQAANPASASPASMDTGKWQTILKEIELHTKTFSEPESFVGETPTEQLLASTPGLAQDLARHASGLVRALQGSSREVRIGLLWSPSTCERDECLKSTI